MEIKSQADPSQHEVALPSLDSSRQALPRVVTEGQVEADEIKRPSGVVAQDCHLKFAEEANQYVREHIRNADQKAGFFFAATTTILAFLHQKNVAERWVKPIQQWSLIDALSFVAMAGLAAGAFVFLIVIFPRLKGSRRGLVFFNAVAEYDTSSEYADEVCRHTAGELGRIKLQHSYDLAKVCRSKYEALRVGFLLGSAGAVATLLYLLLA